MKSFYMGYERAMKPTLQRQRLLRPPSLSAQPNEVYRQLFARADGNLLGLSTR